MATSRRWTGKDGEKQEKTEWHRCSAFGKTGDTIAQYLKKGEPILLEGRVEYRQYEKDGVNMNATNVLVDRFEFVGQSKAEGNEVADKTVTGPSVNSSGKQLKNHAPNFNENEEVPW